VWRVFGGGVEDKRSAVGKGLRSVRKFGRGRARNMKKRRSRKGTSSESVVGAKSSEYRRGKESSREGKEKFTGLFSHRGGQDGF